MSATKGPTARFQTLLGPEVLPLARLQLAVDGQGDLSVTALDGADELKAAITALFAKQADVWDSEEQWREALGLTPVDWPQRTILICRTQVNARQHQATPDKFIILPDRETISTCLVWPRGQGRGHDRKLRFLTRIPETVTLYGLSQLFAEETQSQAFSQDAELAVKLTKWFLANGASLELLHGGQVTPSQEPIRAQDIVDFRKKLRIKGLRHLCPTAKQRRKDMP